MPRQSRGTAAARGRFPSRALGATDVLRFLPDDWLEALLRPFLMLDSVAGIYFEQSAPDLRFAALVLFLVIGALAGRVPRSLDARQRFLLVSLGLLFYVWTLTIGNGRYCRTAP